jgi:hypothetical protein
MIDKLQALVPKRNLSRDEALAVSELQAFRLRQALGVEEPALADHHLKSIDGVRVEQLGELGVSGATRRVGNLWIVLVNQDEARVRNRFTIAHELKHILDDRATTHLHRRGLLASGQDWLTERVCDYFAACLLMPRLWVRRAWTSGNQSPIDLARLFEVSIDAMRIRLQHLGLTEATPRCALPEIQLNLPARAVA